MLGRPEKLMEVISVVAGLSAARLARAWLTWTLGCENPFHSSLQTCPCLDSGLKTELVL